MQTYSQPIQENLQFIAAQFKDYAYRVSHDLNTPIRAMVDFSKILISEYDSSLSEEGQLYLSIIIENGVKMQSMMDGLLLYSRLNTMAKPLEATNVDNVVKDCIVSLEDLIAGTETEINVGELPIVVADAHQISTLFKELIENAIKFNQNETPVIDITSIQNNGYWEFSIRDNGIGINPLYSDKIFQMFAKLHTDEEFPGVGVGLALAHKIVQRHGGQIWCEPNPNGGSTFSFSIPVSESDIRQIN